MLTDLSSIHYRPRHRHVLSQEANLQLYGNNSQVLLSLTVPSYFEVVLILFHLRSHTILEMVNNVFISLYHINEILKFLGSEFNLFVETLVLI